MASFARDFNKYADHLEAKLAVADATIELQNHPEVKRLKAENAALLKLYEAVESEITRKNTSCVWVVCNAYREAKKVLGE